MDDARFDTLARYLTAVRSRRSVARLVGGLSLGGILSTLGVDAAAAAKLIGGSSCKKDSQCKTGNCLGSGKCSCSRTFPKCKQPKNPCKKATCDFQANRCVTENRTGTCPDDGKPCTNNVCVAGECKHPNKSNGVSCGNDGTSDGTCQDGICNAIETKCGDGIDNDGNGFVDCNDFNCSGSPACQTPMETSCNDGIDNNGDGLVDCADPQCLGSPACQEPTESNCGDGIDNNGDGLVDCADLACVNDPACQP